MKRFATILRYVPRYKRLIFIGFACLITARALHLIVPWLLGDSVSLMKLRPVPVDYIRFNALVIILIMVVWFFFHFGMRFFLMRTSRYLERDLRNRLFDHLLTLSPSFYDRRATGDLMSRVSSDLEQVRQAIGPGVMYLSNTIVVVPIALAYLLSMNVTLTLLTLLPMAAIALVTRVIAPRIQVHSKRVQESAASLSTRAQESFAGARVVKVFAREQSEIEGFDREAEGYLQASMGLARLRAIMRPSLQALEGLGSLMLLYVGGKFLIGGEMADEGTLVSFFAYQRMLVWPMIAIGWVIASLHRGAAAMDRIDEILDTEPEVRDGDRPTGAAAIRGEIEFRDLTFAYDGTPVLTDINLTIPAGSTLAIVGPTGAGKSTLVELLLRMYPAPPGTVTIDGVDVRSMALADLRKAAGYVPQETFLFSDTIRANIGYGVEEATEEQVLAAATRSRLADEVRDFPKGYDTMLGERGVNLSGGQKQRTALARALILDPPILILDDAFSSVDTQTEERILREIEEVMARRTTILIGHRVSTVKAADRIVFLDEGRIVETGSHEELMALGGQYARMERLQRLEAELEAIE